MTEQIRMDAVAIEGLIEDAVIANVTFDCTCGQENFMDATRDGEILTCGSCGKGWVVRVGVIAEEHDGSDTIVEV